MDFKQYTWLIRSAIENELKGDPIIADRLNRVFKHVWNRIETPVEAVDNSSLDIGKELNNLSLNIGKELKNLSLLITNYKSGKTTTMSFPISVLLLKVVLRRLQYSLMYDVYSIHSSVFECVDWIREVMSSGKSLPGLMLFGKDYMYVIIYNEITRTPDSTQRSVGEDILPKRDNDAGN
jgi:hypothetical protein